MGEAFQLDPAWARDQLRKEAVRARYQELKSTPEGRAALRDKWRRRYYARKNSGYDKKLRARLARRPGWKARQRVLALQSYRRCRERALASMRVYYQKNKAKAYARKALYRELRREGPPKCDRCPTKTLHETGLCKQCRTVYCRACSRPMIQQVLYQRTHKKCLPKDPRGIAI